MTREAWRPVARRQFLHACAGIGAGWFLSSGPSIAREPQPEISRVRIDFSPFVCLAPQYVAEEMLRLEGFASVEFVNVGAIQGPDAVAQGLIDFSLWDAPAVLWALDDRRELKVLAGVHAGCWELVAQKNIDAIRQLKGRRIAIRAMGEGDHAWVAGALAYVGINPVEDVTWVSAGSAARVVQMFADGEVDACFAAAPRDEELRRRGIGRVLVNSSEDRPWSHYFCCMLIAREDFVARHPVATRRFLRAILRAADLCAQEPERVARLLGGRSWTAGEQAVLHTLRRLPFDRWRHQDPADTLRFIGLRFHEVGLIKTHPNRLIAQASDWHFLNELRRELKG